MESEYFFESFRSNADTFDKNFADYLIERQKQGIRVKKCTFSLDDERLKKWATCHFERRS